jgi:DNA uptake protein ComE-like DNA-binding protein
MKLIHLSVLVCFAVAVMETPSAAQAPATKKKPAGEAAKKPEVKEAKAAGAEAEAATKTLTPGQRTKLMEMLNKGDQGELMSLPGIGAGRAKAIQKARPLASPADLAGVEGVGVATLKEIVAHAKAGFPAAEAGTAKKGTTKKAGGGKESGKSKPKGKAESKEKAGADGEKK